MFARCDEELFEVNGVHIEVNPVLIAKKDGLLTLGFGKGLVELCNQVKEKGSLNKAALEMGMSACLIVKHGILFVMLRKY